MRIIYQIADIHITRDKRRKEEYEGVLEEVYKKIEEERGEVVVVICGDMYNEKMNLTAEELSIGTNMLRRLSEISRKVIIIDGNHDININNNGEKSLVYSTIENIGRENIKYMKERESYEEGGIKYIVTPMYNEKGEKNREVTRIEREEGKKNVGLYHGTLKEVINKEGNISAEDFEKEGYEIVMLGDIHKYIKLGKNKNIRYSSSLIQQNYGEGIGEHGMIRWEVGEEKIRCKYIRIRNENVKVKCKVEGEKYEFEEEVIDEEGRKKYKNISVRFIYGKEEIEKSIKTIEEIVKKYEIKNYEEIMEIETEKKNNKERSEEESESEEEKEEEEEVFMRYIEENGIYEKEIGKKEEKKEKPKKKISARQKRIKEEIEKIYKRESETESERESETESEREREEEIKISKEEIKEEYKKIKKEIEREEEEGRIKIKKVEWKNILSYGDRTEINFEEMEEGIIMINGENGSGKSSIVDIIMYGLYETDTKNIGRGISILKDDEKGGYINIEIKKNGREYRIERKIHKNGNYIKCEIKLYENGKNITEDKIRTSNKIRSIVGEGEEVLLGNIMGQMSKMITNVDERTLTKYITEILGGKLHRKINEKVKKEERNIILNTIRNIKEEIRKTETKKNVEEEEEKIREMEEEYKELIKENVKIKIVKEEVENEREEEIREETERMKKELREIERKEEELEEIKEREEEIKKRVKRQEKMVMEIEDSEEEKEEKEEIKEEEYNKECEKCMERKGKMERLRKKNEKIEKQRIKLKEMRKQIEETKKENMEIRRENEEIEKEESEIRNRKEIIEKKIKMKERIKNKIEENENKMKNIKNISKINIREQENKEKKLEIEIRNKRAEQTKLEYIVERNKEYREKYKVYEKKRRIYNFITTVYEKYDFIKSIINKKIRVVNQTTNNIIKLLSNYEVEINYEENIINIYKITSKKTKILINYLSGYEKFICDIALRIAINKYKINNNLNIMIIDEGFGSSDENALMKMDKLFEILNREIKYSIVISHLNDIKSKINNIIQVKKVDNKSKISGRGIKQIS